MPGSPTPETGRQQPTGLRGTKNGYGGSGLPGERTSRTPGLIPVVRWCVRQGSSARARRDYSCGSFPFGKHGPKAESSAGLGLRPQTALLRFGLIKRETKAVDISLSGNKAKDGVFTRFGCGQNRACSVLAIEKRPQSRQTSADLAYRQNPALLRLGAAGARRGLWV